MKLKVFIFLTWLLLTGCNLAEIFPEADMLESEVVLTEELIQPMYVTYGDGLLLLTDAGVMPAIHIMDVEENGKLVYKEGIGKDWQGRAGTG